MLAGTIMTSPTAVSRPATTVKTIAPTRPASVLEDSPTHSPIRGVKSPRPGTGVLGAPQAAASKNTSLHPIVRVIWIPTLFLSGP